VVGEHSEMGSGITSVDCPARANCAVSGGYVARGFNFLVFAGSEHAGKWGRAAVLPGDAALVGNSGKADNYPLLSGDFLSQVACSSPGNCAVAGNYQAKGLPRASAPLLGIERGGLWEKGQATPFVVSESGGRWAAARPVPGLSKLLQSSRGSHASIDSLSCAGAGDCTLIGSYQGLTSHQHVFVASERGGRWSQATAIPGLEALGQDHRVVATQVSCGSANLCAAGGFYRPRGSKGPVQAWVATGIRGRWHAAEPVPGSIALNTNGIAVVNSVPCSLTTCMAGGYYSSKSHQGVTSGFLAAAHGGTWGDATQVPGLARLNTDGFAAVIGVSCAPHGYSAAIGTYTSGATLEERMFETTRSG
jgi:hypothetical protein